MATHPEVLPHHWRLSTDDIPTRDRYDMMREFVARKMMRVELEDLTGTGTLDCNSSGHALPGAVWGTSHVSQLSSARTAGLLQDGADDVLITSANVPMHVSGQSFNEIEVRPGAAVVLSVARAHRFAFVGSAVGFVIRVPRLALAELGSQIGEAPMRYLAPDTPGLALLHGYAGLLEQDPLASEELRKHSVRHLQELMAMVIGRGGRTQIDRALNSIVAARLTALKADIHANHGRTSFSLGWLAARHSVTPRYVQKLFDRDGTSFSDFLRLTRVAQARKLLTDPRNANRSIVSIALECGFPEASALNRAFRRAYGMTPSDARWRL